MHQDRGLALDAAGGRVVVVADTHSRPHPDAGARISALGPRAIVHCGDVGDLEVLRDLEAIAPVFAVRGNIDREAPALPDTLTIDVSDPSGALARILVLHIAVYGPLLRADVAKKARALDVDLVLCGHSHVPFARRDRGLTVFNPGSIGPRRFGLPIVFGVVDVSRAGISVRHVDCETGEVWLPPR
ncbi:MAG: metallophosphoesterase family protein [Polyangiaceae bacterium]